MFLLQFRTWLLLLFIELDYFFSLCWVNLIWVGLAQIQLYCKQMWKWHRHFHLFPDFRFKFSAIRWTFELHLGLRQLKLPVLSLSLHVCYCHYVFLLQLVKKYPYNQEYNFDLNSRVNLDLCTYIQENKEHKYLMWFGQITYIRQPDHQQTFLLREKKITFSISIIRKPQPPKVIHN